MGCCYVIMRKFFLTWTYGHIMSAPNYYLHWINLFLLIAKPITTDNPLAKGWCIYTEAVDFD